MAVEQYFEIAPYMDDNTQAYLCAPVGLPGRVIQITINDAMDGCWWTDVLHHVIHVDLNKGIMQFEPRSMNPCGEVAVQHGLKSSTKERFLLAMGVL